jgi:hypothetical protein
VLRVVLTEPNKDVAMTAKKGKVLIEVDARHEAILRRALALTEELEQLALTAQDGQVVHECEAAVIAKGRELQRQLLSEAVQRRLEAVEKKGRPCDVAPVVGRRKTKGRRNGSS